jgi:hypothetical protein
MTLIEIFIWIIILILILLGFRKLQKLSSFTGGKIDEYIKRWEVYAPKAYQKIRETDDLIKISKNTGLSQAKITKIKQHIFYKKHLLDDGYRLFDPDPDIADAWLRLQKGTYNEQDLRLLEHEYFEARFEGIFQTDYRTAHNATIKSGRTWTP